ncbi:MAG: 50S ribosomal protein L24 [Deltaproteobacteria bacterium RIFOXYA12_FULL_61_11]|nr:MAG: 50S ribosomal protein L24 [Deltaproteobacteria bacterium RIFOXYA12_FULL_61_11]
MATNSFSIKKNDLVKVIAGKEKGKTGRVLKILREKQRALVERVNMQKRHTKPSQRNRLGGIVEKEGSIHISNLMVICPQTHKPTRIKYSFIKGDGKGLKKVRLSVKSGEIIDKK